MLGLVVIHAKSEEILMVQRTFPGSNQNQVNGLTHAIGSFQTWISPSSIRILVSPSLKVTWKVGL